MRIRLWLGCLLVASLPGVGRAAPAACGDLDGDTFLESADVARFRDALARAGAPLGLDEEIRCNARIDSSLPGGSTVSQAFDDDCTVLDVVILSRALAGLWPEPEAICPGGSSDDCCTTNALPGCDTPEVVACVCASLPECCAAQWSADCAAAASTLTCGGASPGAAACADDGGTPATQTWLAGSVFQTAGGDWWSLASGHPRVFVADANGDERDDLVGIASNGDVWVSPSTGTAFDPASIWRAATVFSVGNGWWDANARPRVWLADVTGDGATDIVGVANDGDLWVSESTGSAYAASRLVAASVFTTPAFFTLADQQRVFVGDVTADGKADVVGVQASGDVHVARATGAAAVAAFDASATPWRVDSVFKSATEWFETASRARVFLADVTGDGAEDLVGLAKNGDLWVSEALPDALAFAASRNVVNTRLRTTADSSTSFLSLLQRPRIFLGDVTGDGKTDLVGIAPTGTGDGDVWLEIATGSGTTADFTERVALRESVFRTAYGWFALTEQARVWLSDVTGDGRADLVGLANDGDVWVARSAAEVGSPGAPAPGARHFFQPSERFGDSLLSSANGLLATATHPRVFPADVTGDGVSDLVGVAPGGGAVADGDVLWRMAAPARVIAATELGRAALESGAPFAVDVELSRSVAPASVTADALRVYSNGARVAPSNVSIAGKSLQVELQVAPPPGGALNLDLELATTVTDLWGNALDGDGDGFVGGRFERRRSWSAGLLAGHARAVLTEYPFMAGLPGPSGFGRAADVCPTVPWDATTVTSNPPYARTLVLAGGGSCAATSDCRAEQTCVAGWCQAPDGRGADRPLAIVSVDLVGFNPGRARALIAARSGIDPERVVIAATHAHAVVRNIRLFDAPYFDDRWSNDPDLPYESWIENRIADSVAEALRRLQPAELDAGGGFADLSINRWLPTAPDPIARYLRVRWPGGRVRSVLVNYAMHPVSLGAGGADPMNADFPGYMATALEASYCPLGGCTALFVNGGAGDIVPSGLLSAELQGQALAAAVESAPESWTPTEGMQIALERQVRALPEGITSCNYCTSLYGPRNDGLALHWDAEATAAVIGVPHQNPVLAFGTVPGEPFSHLQARLRSNVLSALLFGYADGYLGYFANDAAMSSPLTYGFRACANADGDYRPYGPTYFDNVPPTPGERIVSGLLEAINDRLAD